MRTAKIALGFAAAVSLAASAFAQSYPTKSVRVIIPFTPGSGIDIIGRSVSQKLSEMWGQPVVVENRTGAGGTVGAGVVAFLFAMLAGSTSRGWSAGRGWGGGLGGGFGGGFGGGGGGFSGGGGGGGGGGASGSW